MSYDIELKDPVTGKTVELPIKHIMTGGTYRADYDEKTGKFSPMPTSDAWLNVTYNYNGYYYDATEGDERFFGKLKDDYEKDEPRNLGIRGIYGKTGAQSIPMLNAMISRIEEKYKKDGEWIETERKETRYLNSKGKEVDRTDVLHAVLHGEKNDFTEEEYTEIVSEGPNRNYWKATAGNAIKPLYQLMAMAELRPDGVWDGD